MITIHRRRFQGISPMISIVYFIHLRFEVNEINHIFGDFMTPKFNLEVPFETKPPRLKDLVNRHMMGQVWIRDTPFGPVTDSLILSKKFNVRHDNILRAI